MPNRPSLDDLRLKMSPSVAAKNPHLFTNGKEKAGHLSYCINIEPIGKPRMTQQDKWKKRPAVVRYRNWCDKVRKVVPRLPDNIYSVSWKAYFSMPKSWSKKKKENMAGTFHQSKPDRDNVDKAILDCLLKNDAVVSIGTLEKRWDDGHGARIELVIIGQ